MTTAVPQSHTPPYSHDPSPGSTGPPPRVSRRKLLARIGCGTLTGGLAIGGGLTWAFGPGGPLSYEARRLRALKNDPMGAKTILGLTAVHTEESELPRMDNLEVPRSSPQPMVPRSIKTCGATQKRIHQLRRSPRMGKREQIRLAYIMVRTTLPPRLERLHGVSHRTEPVQFHGKECSPCSS